MQPPEPIDPNFRIELPIFEGPLDLLLHLCRKHELDILDLPISFVTERYLAYLGIMKQLNLDVAAEYLLMAATLAHIKSKLLLPTPPSDQEDEELDEMDPRQELIRRLLEYQKYKGAAEALSERGIAGRDVFVRGIPAPQAEGQAELAEVGLFRLLDAFQVVLKRAQKDLSFEINAERISIQERITQIVERLRGVKRCSFEELFEDVITTYDIVVTFLALLEMAKMRMMRVYQPGPTEPIHLEYRVSDAIAPEAAAETLANGPEAGHTSEPQEPDASPGEESPPNE